MIDWIIGLFLWVWVSPLTLGIFVLCAMVSDQNGSDDNGGSIFFFLLSLGVLLPLGLYDFLLSSSYMEIFYSVVAYILVGVVYSVIKYKAWLIRKVTSALENPTDYQGNPKKVNADCYSPSSNVSLLSYWITCWPVSLLGTMFDRLITLSRDIVNRYLRGLYIWVFESSIEPIEKHNKSIQENSTTLSSR